MHPVKSTSVTFVRVTHHVSVRRPHAHYEEKREEVHKRARRLKRFFKSRRRRALALIALLLLMCATIPLLPRKKKRGTYSPINTTDSDRNYIHAKECFKVSGIDLSGSVPDHLSSKLTSHYREVLKKTAPWRSRSPEVVRCHMNFCGPWLENWWIDYFCCDLQQSSFGPYVPLFIQWTDFAETMQRKTHGTLRAMLRETLRPDVVYITVSQDAEGIRMHYPSFPNILVLGSGGVGHVPLPHLFKPLELATITPTDDHFISFTGERNRSVRQATFFQLDESLQEHKESPVQAYGYHHNWTGVVQDSELNIAPRGYGATSYRLYEVMQMGAIPLSVWGPYHWLPYKCPSGSINPETKQQRGLRWEELIFELEWSTDEDLFRNRTGALVDELMDYKLNNPNEFNERRARITALKESYFTYAGIMSQIHRFMVDPMTSDLCCAQMSSCFTMSTEPGTHFKCQIRPEVLRQWGATAGEWAGDNGPLGP